VWGKLLFNEQERGVHNFSEKNGGVYSPAYHLPMSEDEIGIIGTLSSSLNWASATAEAIDGDEYVRGIIFWSREDALEWVRHCEESLFCVPPQLKTKLVMLYRSIMKT
jgi:hypothetical protein